ncbi:MAG: ATP-binding protein [Methylococcaceae bacterium]|nr:ATP-binding protein [Methylococcaceae bacterium]
MNYSLRQLLLVSLLSASMLIWGIAAYVNYKVTRDEVANLFDAELAQSAKVLNAFVESLLREGSLSGHWSQEQEKADELLHTYNLNRKFTSKSAFQLWPEDAGLLFRSENEPAFSVHGFYQTNIDDQLWPIFDGLLQANALGYKYERKTAFQLWSKKDGLMLRSDSAPTFAFSSSDHGFSETNIDNHVWHVFSITNSTGEYIIHVGQKEEIRTELTDEISSQLVTQFLIGLPFLGVVIWFIVGLSLKPINRLEKALSKREASFLKPLSTKKLPNEIVPVVNEINNLFVQLERAFEHERRFTADASHELRTPLAGLLTQAHVALRTTDEEVRKQALSRIKQAVNRMTYMVQQLLTFSRIESNTEFLTKQNTMVSREVVHVIAELEPEAHKKQIVMEFVEDNAVPVIVNGPLVAILIRNIIDNAIKYTPAKGNVLITVAGQEKYLQLCVEDSGPGIPPDQYEKSLERFHRCVETANTAKGTGLGFSIVQRIAAIHNADLILGVSQFGGLKVTVLFPLPIRPVDKSWQKKLSFFHLRKSN